MLRVRILSAVVLAALAVGAVSAAETLSDSLTKGTVELKSAGPLTFGPEGILFIGDPQAATIHAVATGDTASGGSGAIKIDKIDEKIAGMLGIDVKDITIADLAVNPASGNAFLSVARGKGDSAKTVLLKIDRKGEIKEVALKDVKCSKSAIPNASEKARQEAITQIGYVKGAVIVAGLSNEEFASKLRSIPFPFKDGDKGASVEIFHGAHGRFETNSPVRTFTIYDIKGETNVLAAYQCTPLVRFPLTQLKPGEKVKGTTIAELGNRNKPLDMFVYQKEGKDYILIANSSRGMMKVTTENIEKVEGITQKINDKAGLTYETIASMKGVQQMAKLDKDHVLVLLRTDDGQLNLSSVALP